MESRRIPLFPLEVVLLPGTPLPLHIFEPRYKLMINRCLDNHEEFGVVLARQQAVASVGCTAEIVKVLKRYPDGRMDILTAGRHAFQLLALHNEQPYLEGSIEILEEEAAPAAADTMRRVLLSAFQECHKLLFSRAAPALEEASGIAASYFAASQLPLDLEAKQALLELRDESERLNFLLERIARMMPELRKLDKRRKTAGGNGHGPG
jgi:ATP-dependent Lon protease